MFFLHDFKIFIHIMFFLHHILKITRIFRDDVSWSKSLICNSGLCPILLSLRVIPCHLSRKGKGQLFSRLQFYTASWRRGSNHHITAMMFINILRRIYNFLFYLKLLKGVPFYSENH